MRRALIPAFLLLLGSAVLGATVFEQPLAWAGDKVTSVLVTNDASQPVPVHEQGTANVNVTGGSATLPVRDQNVDSSGNIKIHEQGTASVKSADNPASQSRFYVKLSTLDPIFGRGPVSFTVPAGRRLVIQDISGTGATVPTHNPSPAESDAGVEFSTDVQHDGPPLYIGTDVVVPNPGSGTQYFFNESLTLYVDGGSTFAIKELSGVNYWEGSVFGYLVDMP